MGARATIVSVAASVALAVAVAPASAQDIGFCKAAEGAAKNITGKGVSVAQVKAFDIQGGGTSCQYGGTINGSYIQRIPHMTLVLFKDKQKQMNGTTVSGFVGWAFLTEGSNGYNSLDVLKGTTQIVIYSKASLSAEKAAAKAVLPLVH